MKILEPGRLVDALIAWGRHEGEGRNRLPSSTFDGEAGALNAIEIALVTRGSMIGPMLSALPLVVCWRIEIEASDLQQFRAFNGKSIQEDTADILKTGDAAHVLGLAHSPNPVTGPAIFVAQGAVRDGKVGLLTPAIAYDGRHRLAAWHTQSQSGRAYPLDAYLVVTQGPISVFGLVPG